MSGKAYDLSENNQPIWEAFAENRMKDIISKQMKKRGETDNKAARLSLSQYKEAAILLNSLCGNFNKLTPEIIRKAKGIKPQKAVHINGFILDVVGSQQIKVNRGVIIEILPAEYRPVANLL